MKPFPFSSLHRASAVFASAVFALASAFALTLASAPARAQIAMRLTDASAAPVTVQSADITTEVTGRLAVTTFDLVFANPNSRVLEGTFEFPLLDGQRVVRFALDINGALREAVPVEKEKGRVVFEEIERRRVDPGLLEQTAGNNYRARIFPIPANGTRRVVIAYQEDIAARSGAKLAMAPRYRLALDFPTPLKTFSLTVKTFSAPGAKPAKTSTTLPLALPAWSDGHVLTVRKENFTARGVLEIELPAARPASASVLTQTFNDREYFYAEAPLSLPAAAPMPRPAPKCVGILWDASGSGRTRDHEREFALLDKWFARVSDVEVRLTCLRDCAAAPVTFKVRKGDWSELRAALEKTIYDGATSFDGLADDPRVDEWLLFSDGLINFGATQTLEKLPFRAPVHTVNASASAAPALLRRLAANGGGEFVDLLALDANAAASRLRAYRLKIISVERDPETVTQVFPEAGTPVDGTSNTLVVTGILRKPTATVRLKVGMGNRVLGTIEIPLKSGEGASTLAARAWAIAKIENLTTAPGDNREDIRRTSREFHIVTPDTSLIVLETLDDYIRYDIEPPPEDAALHDAWLARRRDTDAAFNKNREQQIERIVKLFNERVAWWEKDFPKSMPDLSKEKDKSEAASEGSWRVQRQGVASTANFTVGGNVADMPPPAPATVSVPVDSGGASDKVVEMSVFEVRADRDVGYQAINTTAGSRVQTPLQASVPSVMLNSDGTPMLVNGATVNLRAGEQQTRQAPQSSALAQSVASPQAQSQQQQQQPQAQPADTALQRWSPAASYLDHLRRAPATERFAVYLEERADHAREPGFYLDVAGYFFDEAKDTPAALQILSNLAELGLEDAALLRVLGYRLTQAGRPDLALPVFERVLKIRGEEPQSRRDLALVCAKLGQFQRAVDLLWEVVSRPWDARFPEIEMIALNEMNAIIATSAQTSGEQTPGAQPLDLSRIDPRLLKNLPAGLRVILTWDADNCDIDLWVDDPNGERAMYNHPQTYQGGRMSKDFTQGYGPEEFLLRAPKPGKYTVRINYYGDSRQTALGPVTAQLRLITDFGTPREKEKLITVRLVDKKESLEIGTLEIGAQ